MVGHLLKSISRALLQFEAVYLTPIIRGPPALEWIPVLVQHQPTQSEKKLKSFDLGSIFDGFLWGVPTCRRSVEKRSMRRFGAENWTTGKKLIPIRKDLKACHTCGHTHEAGRLCPNCYEKIRAETAVLQEQMIKEQGLSPIDREVAILYEGEKQQHPDEYFQGKRIVEIKKARPAWFSKNLLQKSSPAIEQGTSEASAIVKPHDLG